jgi:tight adherence protein B
MSRTNRLLRFAPLVAAALLVPAAAGANGPTLTEARGASFPDREFVLTLPTRVALDRTGVQVQENGRTISEFSIVPASEAAGKHEFGVVLVTDTSVSMRGEPIRAAIEAVRSFASQRHANQELAMVTFDSEVVVRLPLTADATRIAGVLASRPPLSPGTHLYDGVVKAIGLLAAAEIRSGSIVVLSDGADTASATSLTQAVAAAQAAHVRIFAVGLRSKAFRETPLRTLAEDSGGAYLQATSAAKDLPRIYGDIAATLASEYVLSYRSLEGPGELVRVEVRSKQFKGAATATYTTPKLSTTPTPAYHRSLEFRFWSSAVTALLVSAFAGGLVAIALVLILKPRTRSVRERLSGFVSLGAREEGANALPDRLFAGAEESLVRTRWWGRFKRELELARISMPAIQIVLWTIVATLFGVWLVYSFTGSRLIALFAFSLPLAVRGWIKRKAEKVRSQFAEQLPDNLQVLASALRAGHSLVGALSVVVDDAPDPARSEFQRVIADEQLGIPLEDSLLVVAERMESRDLEQVALVASLQRETGGNTAEVLDHVTATIRERFELRRMVKTLTAQGRASRWIVSFLPLGLLAAILAINPRYVEPLFTHSAGRILLVIATVMIITGSVVIGRIVKIRV